MCHSCFACNYCIDLGKIKCIWQDLMASQVRVVIIMMPVIPLLVVQNCTCRAMIKYVMV